MLEEHWQASATHWVLAPRKSRMNQNLLPAFTLRWSAANVAELLEALDEETLKQIASAKMEGYTNLEIAGQLDCSERSVKRKLKVIRTLWLSSTSDESDPSG